MGDACIGSSYTDGLPMTDEYGDCDELYESQQVEKLLKASIGAMLGVLVEEAIFESILLLHCC